MKKQIIAAAVAATMTSVALADISITGATKINYTATEFDDATTTNAVKNETDVKITGKNGDTTVVINLEMDDSGSNAHDASAAATGGLDVEDVYMTTKVGDITVKAGDWDNGNNFLRGSTRSNNQLELGTTMGPVGITYWSGHGASDDKITLKTDLGGVGLKYVSQAKDSELVASANLAGIGITYHMDNNDTANTDKSSLELTGKLGDFGVKVVQIDTDSGAVADGDTWAGDFEDTTSGAYESHEGADVTAIEVSTNVAGNGVRFIHTKVDALAGSTSAGSADVDANKVVVTRPLASGATFELTYTAQNVTGNTAESSDSLDLELAVKF
jgi:hypothetical protein